MTNDSLHDSTSPNNKDLTNESLYESTLPNNKVPLAGLSPGLTEYHAVYLISTDDLHTQS